MLREYYDLPDERRYPFVVPARELMPTHSRHVWMRRKAGLVVHWDDYPDSSYDPTGSSDGEDEDAPPPPSSPRVLGSAATAEAEAPSKG